MEMTRETALHMLDEYNRDLFDLLPNCSTKTSNRISSLMKPFPENGETDRAMRWLGCAQGVLLLCCRYALNDLIEHTQRGYVHSR